MNISQLVTWLGYWGVWMMILFESGLFLFFFPGDSLLITAGILASQGHLDIGTMIAGCVVFAVLGNTAGYAIGKNMGTKVFNRPKSWLFNKQRLQSAHNFYESHGALTILLARFIPVVRTFVPVAAGVAKMNYRSFMFYNLLGGVLWAAGLTLLGYWLGSVIPEVDKYILPILAVIIALSLIPGVIHYLKEKGLKKDKEILKKGLGN